MKRALTLYYNPEQAMLHILTSQVDAETGAHIVIKSELVSCTAKQFPISVQWCVKQYGADKVRAYTVTEFQ